MAVSTSLGYLGSYIGPYFQYNNKKINYVLCLIWASIKPGTWNIPEHTGTFRNIPEHPGT